MWESIVLTVVATAGNNIGKILQKKGTVILPPLSFKFKVIRAYALNKTWLVGFLMDIFGALLMLRALALAPVSVIQSTPMKSLIFALSNRKTQALK
ncbi:probable magnesium transporter NIPA9 [Vigna radiata var. radiata]|uniref:Probable magnesium transporter NIPA9 n=1 Tax=Vigna radiata var. radiata TaxID=3916 RepID=A0A1S3U5D1_VIGRR|nr:probable magnesium transporter NIPA9 [Vigna radiata var. radiata]